MMRRSLPATLSRSQSSVRVPTWGWFPQLGEAVTVRAQLGDQAPEPLVRRIAARRRAQVGDLHGLERALGLWCVAEAAARAEEVAPDRVALVAVVLTHECRVQRVGQQQRPCRVGDRDGCPGQPVEHPLNARGDVGGHRALPRRHEPGDLEQVLALGSGQAQSPAQGLDDLFRRVGRSALFEAGDVVDGDPGEQGELLAAQPRRAPMASDGQPGRLRGDTVAPVPHRAPELRGRHDTTVHRRARMFLVLTVSGTRDGWLTVPLRRIVEP